MRKLLFFLIGCCGHLIVSGQTIYPTQQSMKIIIKLDEQKTDRNSAKASDLFRMSVNGKVNQIRKDKSTTPSVLDGIYEMKFL